jgi:hypothetical protein
MTDYQLSEMEVDLLKYGCDPSAAAEAWATKLAAAVKSLCKKGLILLAYSQADGHIFVITEAGHAYLDDLAKHEKKDQIE